MSVTRTIEAVPQAPTPGSEAMTRSKVRSYDTRIFSAMSAIGAAKELT